jgi:aminoglycoside phosphotransferase (APT) family kinase protein
VPVPRPVAHCPSADVIGAPFYVMEDVPGLVLRDYEDSACLTPGAAGELSRRLGETLAAIHGVDLAAAGLADFGRGAGYLRRQLDRWQRQWDLSTTREVPGYASLVRRLADGLPADGEVTLVHGDFRLDNTIVTLEPAPRIAAVVDWEMATLGDPLADLGLTLTYWSDPGEEASDMPIGRPTAAAGFMTRDEFAGWYGSLTGRDVSGIGYYSAFGCFKLAVVMEGIHARFLKGLTVGEGFDSRGDAVPALIARAHRLLDG